MLDDHKKPMQSLGFFSYFLPLLGGGILFFFVAGAFFAGVWYGTTYMKPSEVISHHSILPITSAENTLPDYPLIAEKQEILEEMEKPVTDSLFVTSAGKRPVAVMIDNVLAAQSFQAGVSDATVVYESPAEAGITRFLIIYPPQHVQKKIGPVRSLRPYFLSWAEEYNSLLAHAGGSDTALRLAKLSTQISDMDDMTGTGEFYRDATIQKPHNLFTSTNLLRTNIPLESERFQRVKREDRFSYGEVPSGNIENIHIDFLDDTDYSADWEFERESKVWKRKGRKNIEVKNVVVQVTDWTVLDKKLRLNLRTTGTGAAVLFANGSRQEGYWKKGIAEDAKTRFYTNEGEEMIFLRGKIWISVVNDKKDVRIIRKEKPEAERGTLIRNPLGDE